MEEGTLTYFDDDVWGNFNTGTLEQYLNEKTRVEGFERSKFVWKRVMIGIAIGVAFAVINQYIGLKVGTIIGAGWYVVYMLGLALKWKPTDVNIAAGASTGASATCTGFVFSFPAIYLLASHPDYAMEGGTFLVSQSALPPTYVPVIAAILGGWLGVLYFTIFRRVWLVEDPLPVPGFEASITLVGIANDISGGAREHAQKAIRLILMMTGVAGVFTFLRDWPVANDKSVLDNLIGGRYYHRGEIFHPNESYTHIGFEFIPIQLGYGWFMRFRTAMLINLGTFFTWFVIIPMAIILHMPVYMPVESAWFDVAWFSPPVWVAYGRVARVIAIGAILGGGLTALAKMAPVFKTATADIFAMRKGGDGSGGSGGSGGKAERQDFVEGKGWFEWPMTHIPIMAVIVVASVFLIFTTGGFPASNSLVFAILLVFVMFILGAIGVKVMGETGSTPVSGTSFIVLLLLYVVFKVMQTDSSTMIIMMLIGSSVFGTALSLSSDIIHDFKIGTYCGTRPYHLVKGELTAIPLGAIAAVTAAVIFSQGLASGALDLKAPQAHAFATFTQIILGPNPPYQIFFIGILIGIVAEFTTGMGTAFGLGMYLPLPVTVPLIVGGAYRDWWEKNRLEPKAKAENWTETQKTLKTVETYMIATGLIIGEAIMGSVIAIYMVLKG
jgi:putative OPT family oligopeptide transporter